MEVNYDLGFETAINEIKKHNAKLVCLQLPDGLKPKAQKIQQNIQKNIDIDVVIWAGSCFGACDLPLEIERMKFDLLLHWGHPVFKK